MERKHDTPEIRTFSEFEARQQTDGSWKVGGYASTFNDPYPVNDRFGTFTETILPGTWDRTLSERGHKIQLVETHSGLPYASTKAKNLRLGTDQHGLEWEARLSRDSQRSQDLGVGIRDGYIDELSVGMNIPAAGDSWSPDMAQRTVSEASLFHIAVVARGANPNTAATMREAELLAEIRELRSMMDSERTPDTMTPHAFVDENGDGKCDVCGMTQTEHDSMTQMNAAQASDESFMVTAERFRQDLAARQFRLPITQELAQLLERRK